MILKKLILPVLIIICSILQNRFIGAKKRDEVDEKLLHTRCKLMFYENNLDHTDNSKILNCIESIEKPGICPAESNLNTGDDVACLEKCNHDYRCSATKKCCKQNCGWICLEPNGLIADEQLPPIPFNLSVPARKHKGRSCDISWQLPINRTDRKAFIVIVEGRSHIGSVFSEHKLGDWQWYDTDRIAEVKAEQTSIKTVVRVKLRKGRWYQFRVAAINEFGFKGYSNSSNEFKLSDFVTGTFTDPKIPQIVNFTITPPKLLQNGSVYAKASWTPEKSDIPIEKYHMSWALHLKADNDSLYLNDASVKEPIRTYEFWNLNVNSTYFVQVKAISYHGKRKLKSPKEALFLNTTITTWDKEIAAINWKQQNHLASTSPLINTGYSLRKPNKRLNNNNNSNSNRHLNVSYKFIPNKRYGILVRTFFNRESYNDKLLLEICPGTTSDCETKEYEAAKTKRGHIDFSQVKFNRHYTMRLIDNNSMKKKILWWKTIVTPSCELWLKRYSGLAINC